MRSIDIHTPTVLVMCSGGLDSTAALWRILIDPRYENLSVHAHHVRIHDMSNRYIPEREAFYAVISRFKTNGFTKLSFSESEVEIPVVNGHKLLDSDIHQFIAGHICLNCLHIQYVATGLSYHDMTSPGITVRLQSAKKSFELFMPGRFETMSIEPVKTIKKDSMLQQLPKSLIECTWSCRNPRLIDRLYTTCGSCKPCRDLAAARISLAQSTK
jgi:7-cyano-7-deazaguanine synthase in queuosine biosynthesis